ncbi:hypothetical protein K492DRAFT_203828 [Lichtheimia hyalospora FSU 10163]|nr:hypothetical protein K492DRAFT_203828 [Lichtheimia hyalospora FSU 10163]
MNFEDIVDMDWLNSNTTNDNTLSPASIQDDQMVSFPTANYSTDNALYAFSDPSLFWPNDLAASSNDLGFKFDLPQPQSGVIGPVPSDKQTTVQQPESKLPELVMPSTEHIKQLIEIAKQHLALREQQQKLQVQGEPTSFTPGALPIPALFATSATNPSTTSLSSTMPNTVSPESLMKGAADDMDEDIQHGNNNNNNMGDNKKSSSSSSSSISGASRAASVIPEETMTLEAYAESDGIDIKKLTPKERRQLRNKISARNFRVRRKEYISTLEAQVDDHKKRADQLQSRLDDVENENKQLRQEVDALRRQNQLLQQQQQKSVANSSSSSSSSRVSSPIPKPNLNKDISMLGSKASETYRQDTRILVSNAVMPVWDYHRILQQPNKSTPPTTLQGSQVMQCATHIVTSFVQFASAAAALVPENTPSTTTLLQENNENEIKDQDISSSSSPLPLLPDDRDFTSRDDKLSFATPSYASSSYMEYLYDTLIMSALNNNADKSFCWWEEHIDA